MEYLRDPDEIFRASMREVGALPLPDGLPQELASTARRIAHACGSGEVLAGLRWRGAPVAAAKAALAGGAPVLCDCEMLRYGVIESLLPAGVERLCWLNEGEAAERGRAAGITRSAAAVETGWPGRLEGALAVVGNAPTALFRLLEGLREEGWPRPAAIYGFPVGFIGAAEAKEALVELCPEGVPLLTLAGRAGGSAIAAAAVNAALRELAAERGESS